MKGMIIRGPNKRTKQNKTRWKKRVDVVMNVYVQYGYIDPALARFFLSKRPPALPIH